MRQADMLGLSTATVLGLGYGTDTKRVVLSNEGATPWMVRPPGAWAWIPSTNRRNGTSMFNIGNPKLA